MKQKRIELVCILTGEKTRVSRVQAEKQFKKLKIDNLEDYQTYFISKTARRLLSNGETESEIRTKHNYKNNTSIPFKVLKCFVKKIRSKSSLKKKRQKKLIQEFTNEANTKGIQFEYKRPESIDLTQNKEVCEEITRTSCWRPDIYLDYGCKHCYIKDNCICPAKNLKREPHNPRRNRK